MSFLGPLISAGASLIGGLVSARGASQAADRSEAFSREAYDYALTNGPSLEMEGLRRAGINPMLRYGTGGQGTPVSMPTMNFPNAFGELGNGIAGAASSAFGTMKSQQEIEESEQRVGNLQVEAVRIGEDVLRIRADTALTTQDRENRIAEQARTLQDTLLREAERQLTIAQQAGVAAQIRVANANVGLIAAQTSTEQQRALTQVWTTTLEQIRVRQGASELPQAELTARWFSSIYGQTMEYLRRGRESLGF